MYRPELTAFAHTRRVGDSGRVELQGVSARYGAIVLLGAHSLAPSRQRQIFCGQHAEEFCGRLIENLSGSLDPGEKALTAWAAATLEHPRLEQALGSLRSVCEASDLSTVETAWALSAVVTAAPRFDVRDAAIRLRNRLVTSFAAKSSLFSHVVEGSRASWYRAHLACFADQVYPILALSRFHRVFNDPVSLEVAEACATRISQLQGPAGQWWWHYDVRTGDLIEGYPVYSVHQDAMAPMALLELSESGGSDHSPAIRRGLRWMLSTPEVRRSLVDEDLLVIWRKVGRSDPFKIVRGSKALATAIWPGARLHWLDRIFPPVGIDFESRPYHLGWILYSWLSRT